VSDTPTQNGVVADESHPVTKPRPPNRKRGCPECGGVYGVPYLYHHMRSVHGVDGGASGVKRMEKLKPSHVCSEPDCGREFDSKHGLAMHVSLKHRRAERLSEASKALVPVPAVNNHQEPTFKISKEWRIVEDDDGTPFLLLSLADLVADRMAH
jgi:hypothetical protein